MCQRCQELQQEWDRATWRLQQKIKDHGGSIPVDHPDVTLIDENNQAHAAFRASIRRHSREAEHPTCVICDGPANIYDEGRDAMVCLEHIPPWSQIPGQ